MKKLLIVASVLAFLALGSAASADPQTDEANRQRQMDSMRAEAARNDQINADRSLAQQQATADAARSSASGATSSSLSSSGSSGGSSGLGASGGYTNNRPQSVVDSYTIVIRTQETPQQMLARLEQEAAGGDVGAQYNLGRIYYTGFNDAPRDDVRARGYFQQAASAGHAPSQASYGYFLTEGIGGPANPGEGQRWLRQAADAGNSFGQAQYGLSLAVEDQEQAARYLIPAAAAGEVQAQAMLGTFYAMGAGVERDDAKAVDYLKAASDQGEMGSTGLLAGMYLTDRGGTHAEGVRLLRQAAEAGDRTSMANYGFLLVQGNEVAKDEAGGAAFIRRAAYAGDNGARVSLGHIYNEGLGVPQSDADAIYWWNLAAEAGDEDGLAVMQQVRTGGDELGRPPTQGTGPVANDGVSPAPNPQSRQSSSPNAPGEPSGRTMDSSPAPTAESSGGFITVGQTIRGDLSRSDSRLGDNSFFDCYAVQTVQGAAYRAVLRSVDFDTYLSVGTGDCAGTPTLSDDDGAEGTDSAVNFTGDGQTWFVRANSLAADTSGTYTVELGEGTGSTSLALGQPITGDLTSSDAKLSDDSYYDCYEVQTSPGSGYRVLMRSADFDAYLSVGSGQCSGAAVQSDDDGGGGTDAAVAFTGDGQTWFVRANSLNKETVGSYSVELTEGTQSATNHAKARTRPGPR
ncbi:tetratricopeptide repeat protein [Brevundimonas sp. TWP2-3-4b1]|uniref:tetratricopeptide repeat protein n=1 Tax=Brevundimonas sp. TWP2-3-4b1 TaxID=2804580 RepID=UPI003CF80C7C